MEWENLKWLGNARKLFNYLLTVGESRRKFFVAKNIAIMLLNIRCMVMEICIQLREKVRKNKGFFQILV